MTEQWNVNRQLGPFVRNPIEFRSQMAPHDALIIFSSFVIQFFDDVFWKESNLDMYVQSGEGVSACGQYFLREEGHRFVEESIEQDAYAESDTAKGWLFQPGTGVLATTDEITDRHV